MADSPTQDPWSEACCPWKPIETAPKTSHAILVYCPERMNTYIVSWTDHKGWMHFGGYGELTQEPSHWMPVPEKPR